MSNKILFVGDFNSNTGPANINKSIRRELGRNALYTISNNRIIRILELILKLLFASKICFCSFSKLNVFGIKIAKLLNKKTFYIMHGFLVYEQKFNNCPNNERLIIEKYILENCDKVFCVSKLLMEKVKSYYSLKNVDYVYNGINWELYNGISIEAKLNNEKEFVVMSTGGLVPQKNNLKVCDAIKIIHEKGMKIKYIIVGDSCGLENLIPNNDYIVFRGKVSHAECLDLMKKSNLYIQNSYFETFGIAIIEALMSNCDIIINENMGIFNILNGLEEQNIVKNMDDSKEIANKILTIMQKSNYINILKKIDKEKTSFSSSVEELLNKINAVD